MEEQAKRIAELLRLLANEHRLLILCALMEGPRTVGELHTFTPEEFQTRYEASFGPMPGLN